MEQLGIVNIRGDSWLVRHLLTSFRPGQAKGGFADPEAVGGEKAGQEDQTQNHQEHQ